MIAPFALQQAHWQEDYMYGGSVVYFRANEDASHLCWDVIGSPSLGTA
jgi:hypothetical protein